MSKLAMVNEDNLFSNVLKNMASPEVLIEELVENARRAKAKKITFDLNGTLLSVSNNGDVLEDFSKLLVLADSSYDEAVCERENPAGMGIYLILSSTVSATFKSGHRTLTVESQRLFNDGAYRNNILSDVMFDTKSEYIQGFRIELDLGESVNTIMKPYTDEGLKLGYPYHERFESRYNRLKSYLDIDILINGELVEKKTFDFYVDKEGTGILEGLRIGINNDKIPPFCPIAGTLYWHGKKIDVPSLAPFTIIVTDSHLFKPQLPDRTTLVNSSDELKEIREEIELQLFDEVQRYLDEDGNEKNKYPLLRGLRSQYNTDNINIWNGHDREEIERSDGIFITYDSDEISIMVKDGKTDRPISQSVHMASVLGNMVSVYTIAKSHQPLPAWVQQRTEDIDDISIYVDMSEEDTLNNGIANVLQKCQAIRVKFKTLDKMRELDTLVLEYAQTVYLTEHNLGGLEIYFESVVEYGERTYDEVYDEYNEYLDTLISLYEKSVDTDAILHSINKLLVSDGLKGTAKSFNYENGKINGLTTEDEMFCYVARDK